jgi:hypothetical protein
MRYLRAAIVMAVAAALALPLAAQRGKDRERPPRSVQGIVTDAQENPIHKAVVQLKNPRNLQIKSFYTDESGKYRFFGLDPNQDYEVRAEFGGASAGPRTVSSFDSRNEIVINFKLDVPRQ